MKVLHNPNDGNADSCRLKCDGMYFCLGYTMDQHIPTRRCYLYVIENLTLLSEGLTSPSWTSWTEITPVTSIRNSYGTGEWRERCLKKQCILIIKYNLL